jgi:GTP-binding protein HflX
LSQSSMRERAVLVHLELPGKEAFAQEDLNEFKALATAAGALVVGEVVGKRNQIESRYFVGSGKAQEICDTARALNAQVILVNHALSPTQERNLEKLCQCPVLDRTGVILDIFAQRARTFEGQLQVELAQLTHLSTRLVRGWTHLERQKGGIGMRGPGETQLETDRRLIRDRIKILKTRLEKVRAQRALGRRARMRAAIPMVSLVGYTNAGKSTLFNRLANSDVFVANQLFATLDPTLRRIELPGLGVVVIADTVGFIRHLPHQLVEAFAATLEESRQADLLLHVIDASDPEKFAKMEAVNTVLAQIDAQEVPVIEVFNKVDALQGTPILSHSQDNSHPSVAISAQTGEGIEALKAAIVASLAVGRVHCQLRLPHAEGAVRAALYREHSVSSEMVLETGEWLFTIHIQRQTLIKIFAQAGLVLEEYLVSSE